MIKKILHSLPFRLLCILGCVICICFLLISNYFLPLSYTPVSYEESTEILTNPYCGFYTIYGYTLSDNSSNHIDLSYVPTDTGNSRRLVMIQINLKNFRNSSLSATALSQLNDILSAWTQTDKHLILRFLYDWDGNAQATEPEDIEIIFKHMEQTASIYNQYSSRIYMIHGLYTGNYGEMHHSYHQSADEIRQLAYRLSDLADPSIYLAVRTPTHWRTITGYTEPTDVIKSTGQKSLPERLSLFNDGMLASASDAGTYGDGERESELLFQNRLCQNVPNGGEVIIDNAYNDLSSAIKDLRTMHVSYLNRDYDPKVLNKWKNSTYDGQDIFRGCSGYDYIAAHLGYRYVLRSSEISFSPLRDKNAKLSLSIENTGFSNSYYPFSLTVKLIHRETKKTITLTTSKTSSYLRCGTTNTLTYSLNVRDYEPGDYDVYFLTADPASGEAIRYANDNMALTENGYLIGGLSLGK